MALRLTLNRPCGIDTRRFGELSALVARASGRPLPITKPITGAGVFRHESGIHVRGLLADRRTYEPFRRGKRRPPGHGNRAWQAFRHGRHPARSGEGRRRPQHGGTEPHAGGRAGGGRPEEMLQSICLRIVFF